MKVFVNWDPQGKRFLRKIWNFTTTITQNDRITDDFYEMGFKWKGPRPWPGNFFMVKAGPNTMLLRPFAFSCYERATKTAYMIYRIVGEGTVFLSQRKVGDLIEVRGPIGNRFKIERGKRPLLITGGAGIGPIAFLASELKQKNIAHDFVIGAKSKKLLPVSEHIKTLNPLIYTENGCVGKRGTIAKFFQARAHSQAPFVIYACGPKGMLKACHQYAVTNKSTAYTAVEAMVACGMAMCLGCAVKASKGGYLQVCKDGPVFDSKDLLWE